MAQIPTVPGSEVEIQTPDKSVRLDPGALIGPRVRGAQALANAIDQVGDVAGTLQADLERQKGARIAADIDLKMRAAQQAFIESTKGDANEDEWFQRAQEMASKVKDDVYSGKDGVPPGMKNQVDIALGSWTQNLGIQAVTMARIQSTKRTEGTLYKDYQEAGLDGAADHMQAVVNLGRSAKLDPVTMDQWERDIPRTVAMTAIQNGLRVNPKGTGDLLKSGAALPVKDQQGNDIVPSKVFSAKELEQLQNTARTQTNAWQKTNLQNLLLNGSDPTTGIVPEQDIRDAVKKGTIAPTDGQSIINRQNRQAAAKTKEEQTRLAREDTDNYHVLSAKIHDPVSWQTNADDYAHELMADAGGLTDPAHRQEAITDINRQLASVKKNGTTAERPVDRQMIELMNKDLRTQGAMVPVQPEDVAAQTEKHGLIGFRKTTETAPATTSYKPIEGGLDALDKMKEDGGDEPWPFPGMKKDDVISAANIHAAKIQNQMHEWFQSPEGEKATFDQANAHRQELERPFVMDAVKATLSKRAPVRLTSPDEVKKLPAGAPFIDPSGQLRYAN
jgi:hypothetical protein